MIVSSFCDAGLYCNCIKTLLHRYTSNNRTENYLSKMNENIHEYDHAFVHGGILHFDNCKKVCLGSIYI